MIDFTTKTFRQIRLWTWAAAVLPITALAALVFVWHFFDNTILGYALIAGETLMFSIAVVWWWWAMYTMRNLVRHWDSTRNNVEEVLSDIKSIRKVIEESSNNDK